MTKPVYVPCCQISEDQKTQDAQEDGQCHEQAGYTVEEPEESPETDDGYGSPYGRYAVCIDPAKMTAAVTANARVLAHLLPAIFLMCSLLS